MNQDCNEHLVSLYNILTNPNLLGANREAKFELYKDNESTEPI